MTHAEHVMGTVVSFAVLPAPAQRDPGAAIRAACALLHEADAAIDEVSLPRLVPDLAQRDLYVCGPEGFVASIVDTARNLGIPDGAIHHEAFAL